MASFLTWGSRGGLVASVRSSLPIRGGIPKRGPKKKVRPSKHSRKEEKRKQFIQLLAQQQSILDDTKPNKEFVDTEAVQRKKNMPAVTLSEEEKYRRSLLVREYSDYCNKVTAVRHRHIREMLESRKKALEELRSVSEYLFRAAISVDLQLFPLHIKAPVETPAIPEYTPPEYVIEKKT